MSSVSVVEEGAQTSETVAEGASDKCLIRELEEENRELQVKVAELTAKLKIDALTGLPNKAGIDEWGRVLANIALRLKTAVMVTFVDLVGFGKINAIHGHGAGDDVLKYMSELWLHRIQMGEYAGRRGGDEFVFGHYLRGINGQTEKELLKHSNALLSRIHTFPKKIKVGTGDNSLWITTPDVYAGVCIFSPANDTHGSSYFLTRTWEDNQLKDGSIREAHLCDHEADRLWQIMHDAADKATGKEAKKRQAAT